MMCPTTKRNYWQWWWNIKRSKIYRPYYWENNVSKNWGFNLPFIGYFARYWGKNVYYELPEVNKYWII